MSWTPGCAQRTWAAVPSSEPLSTTMTAGCSGSAASWSRVRASSSRRLRVMTATVTRGSSGTGMLQELDIGFDRAGGGTPAGQDTGQADHGLGQGAGRERVTVPPGGRGQLGRAGQGVGQRTAQPADQDVVAELLDAAAARVPAGLGPVVHHGRGVVRDPAD